MAIELEKKYRLAAGDRAAIEARLAECGAVFNGESFEENTVFPLLALTGKPAVLRIRRTDGKTILTFKQRVASGSDLKQQIEHETAVSDHVALCEIVAGLGLTAALVYEKRRATWRLGDSEIVLDVLPFGDYMEIEGTAESIRQAEMDLQITELTVEPRTYPNLAAEYGVRNGTVTESRFIEPTSVDTI